MELIAVIRPLRADPGHTQTLDGSDKLRSIIRSYAYLAPYLARGDDYV